MTLGSRNSITAIAQYTQLWLGTKYKKNTYHSLITVACSQETKTCQRHIQ